jgi:hypothetical protein
MTNRAGTWGMPFAFEIFVESGLDEGQFPWQEFQIKSGGNNS